MCVRVRPGWRAREPGENQRSAGRFRCSQTAAILVAGALGTACGGAPEKVVHPEPQPTSEGRPFSRVEPAPAPSPNAGADTTPKTPVAPTPSPAPGAYVPALACDVRGTPVIGKGVNL